MGTATDDLEMRAASERKVLMARPQRLGILPTWSFWNQKDNWRLIKLPFILFMLSLFLALDLLGSAPVVGALIVASVLTVALGLTERYIRARVAERRALAASNEPRDPQIGE